MTAIDVEAREPYVRLIDWTEDPVSVVALVWQHAKAPISAVGSASRDENEVLFRRLLLEWTAIPEFVHFSFLAYDIPRTLLAQLTRHRLFSFFARSQRVDNLSHFSEKGNYFIPPSIESSEGALELYRHHMEKSESTYSRLLGLGIPIEDARHALPEATFNNIAFSCNLRSLFQMVRTRTCEMLQQSLWAPFLQSMRDELVGRVDPILVEVFNPPCHWTGLCMSRLEMERRVARVDPNPVCPIYLVIEGKKEQ